MGSAQLCDDPLPVQAASEQPPDGVNIDVNVVRSQKCDAPRGNEREQELSKMLRPTSHQRKRSESDLVFWKPMMFFQSSKMSWGQ